MSRKKESLSQIDLSKFVKGLPKKKQDPICKGCKYTFCATCREEKVLGEGLKLLLDAVMVKFMESLTDKMTYEFVDLLMDGLSERFFEGEENSIKKLLDSFAMRFINEMKMQIKLDEGG